jgi:hypothetical protein
MLPIPETIVRRNRQIRASSPSRGGSAASETSRRVCPPVLRSYPPPPRQSRPRGLQLWRRRSSAARRTEEIRMTSYSKLRTMPHYCSDCEYEYGNEVTAEAIAAGRVSCPVCGSTNISARALAGTAEAAVTAPSPRVATHSHYPDGTEEIAVGGEGFRSSSIAGGNHPRQDFHGRPAQNEEDVLQVCRSLRAALQRQGQV